MTNIGKIKNLTPSDNKSFPVFITGSGVKRLHFAEKKNVVLFFRFLLIGFIKLFKLFNTKCFRKR
jgi:hypothetical protein